MVLRQRFAKDSSEKEEDWLRRKVSSARRKLYSTVVYKVEGGCGTACGGGVYNVLDLPRSATTMSCVCRVRRLQEGAWYHDCEKDAVNFRSKVEMIHQKGAGREVNQGSASADVYEYSMEGGRNTTTYK